MYKDQDQQLLQGLKSDYKERVAQENVLYLQYNYFIGIST